MPVSSRYLNMCEIWGSHDGKDVIVVVLDCNTICRYIPPLWRNVLCPLQSWRWRHYNPDYRHRQARKIFYQTINRIPYSNTNFLYFIDPEPLHRECCLNTARDIFIRKAWIIRLLGFSGFWIFMQRNFNTQRINNNNYMLNHALSTKLYKIKSLVFRRIFRLEYFPLRLTFHYYYCGIYSKHRNTGNCHRKNTWKNTDFWMPGSSLCACASCVRLFVVWREEV